MRSPRSLPPLLLSVARCEMRPSARTRTTTRHVAERHVLVEAALPRHAQHALGHHVARHLERPAPDAAALTDQVVDRGARRRPFSAPGCARRSGHLEPERPDALL